MRSNNQNNRAHGFCTGLSAAQPQTRRIALMVSSILAACTARAAEDGAVSQALDEVIVTAQKRTENLQSVPLSVEVLDTKVLQERLATSFDDYVKYLPSLYSKTFGPGQEDLYIRGVTNGWAGLRVGPQPTVAVYLDEQPVTTIAANLDVHIYDIARVEELSGPQGTLFGSSSLAGTLRIITNPPDMTKFEAGYDLDGNDKPAGAPGGRLEGFVNLPLSTNSAVRLIGFSERDGGYINNVLGPPEVWPTSGVVRSNAAAVERHFNDVTTSGGRAALKLNLTDSWTVTPSAMLQRQTANGIPAYEPSLGDLNVARYAPDRNVDNWWQAALTVQGKIADLDAVYAGAYLRRVIDNETDYSGYTFDYDTFYTANPPDYFGQYFKNAAGQYIPPAETFHAIDHFTKQSQEVRLSAPEKWRLRFVAGLFLQRQVDDNFDNYTIPGLAPDISVPLLPGTYYLNSMSRVDRDRAAFGELTYDLAPRLALTAGLREFAYDNTVFGYFGYASGESLCEPGTLGTSGPGRPCINVNQRTSGNGSTYKLNLAWHLDPDRMLYGTWSTGFRPGGINRLRNLNPYQPDALVNFEGGWKTEWLAHRLRFNGALFYERWKNPQFLVCGPSCIEEVINAGGARTRGVEGELQWRATPALSVSAAATWLEAELTANACVYGNAGPLCRNQAGAPDPTVSPAARAGDPLPVSRFRGNVVLRYTLNVRSYDAHVQMATVGQSALPPGLPPVNPGGLSSGNSPPYTSFDLTSGFGRGNWMSEFYVLNLLDKRGEQNRGLLCSVPTCGTLYVGPIPPRTFGVTFRQRF